jgi:hypothetical protein
VQNGGVAKTPDRTPMRCEACDKDFSGREGYTAHIVSHEKCSEPGCNFEASGKMLVMKLDLEIGSNFVLIAPAYASGLFWCAGLS